MVGMLLPYLLLAVFSAASSVVGAEVKLNGTTITGLDIPDLKVEFFGGLPYADAPVGNLRFRPPVLKARLRGRSFNATQFGKSCLQPALFSTIPAENQSEDCLNINIYRPAGVKPDAKLPVLMWAFGGAYVVGGASDYDGSELVDYSVARGTPIIYVGLNFRLGTLGYPVGQEAHDEGSLNLAQKDMLAALEWVQQNIGAFGGDKRKVTMFGQSSGASQISHLYFAKGIEKLLSRAILQSSVANSLPVWNATERPSLWPSFVKNVPSCSTVSESRRTLDCLRKASEEEIKKSYLNPEDSSFQLEWWQPTIDAGSGKGKSGKDGEVLPDYPTRLFERGAFANISFIAGNNLDEGTAFAADARSSNYTSADLKNAILALYAPASSDPNLNTTVDKILELYPDIPSLGSPYGTGEELFGFESIYKRASAIQGDLTFGWPLRQWMQLAAKRNVTSFGYLLSHRNPLDEPALGVPHGAEIPYIFGNTADPTDAACEVEIAMMDYWISFSVSGNPNDGKGTQRPRWPRYTTSNPVLIQLDGGANLTTINDDFRANQIAFLTTNATSVLRR